MTISADYTIELAHISLLTVHGNQRLDEMSSRANAGYFDHLVGAA